MKKVIISLVLVGSVLSADCMPVLNKYLQYSGRVLTALEFGVTPDALDLEMTIHYCVKAASDCQGDMDDETVENLKKSIIIFRDYQKR